MKCKLTKANFIENSADLTNDQLLDIIDIVKQTQIAGVIATNTTIARGGLHSLNQKEMGGLSGKPLKSRFYRSYSFSF